MDEECFLSYGPLSNLKLLLFYGMTIKNNPYDVVPVNFTVSQQLSNLWQHAMACGRQLRHAVDMSVFCCDATVVHVPLPHAALGVHFSTHWQTQVSC